MMQYIKDSIKDLKNHIFGILSVIVKYLLPVGYVIVNSWSSTEKVKHLQGTAIFVLVIMAIIYYFIIKRYLTGKREKEDLIIRLNNKKGNPLALIIFTFIDDVIAAPIIPFVLWIICDILQSFGTDVSLAFLVMGILFIIGGIFKLIDVIINLSIAYKEGD